MTNAQVAWKVVSVGVDYLTVTAKANNARQILLMQGELMSSRAERNGDQQKPWRSQGYDGWKCGQVTYGEREDSAILKLSGRVDPDIVIQMNHPDLHCTRIDVQVTARSIQRWPSYGEAAMLQAEWDRECLQDKGEAQHWGKIRRMDGRGAGDTITVGSRSSKRYGRLYDKAAQSGEEQYWNCWRWEYEYKEELAPIVLQRIANRGACADVIAGVVAWQYNQQCFNVPWEHNEGSSVDGPGRVESDAQRKMRWFRTQVKPTVIWLIENGHIDNIEDLMV